MSSLQGIMALDSPYTGIVDWRMVALRYGEDFEEAGGKVVTESEVDDISMVKESSAGTTEGNEYFSVHQYVNTVNSERGLSICNCFFICRNEISNRSQRQKGKTRATKSITMFRLCSVFFTDGVIISIG